MTSDPASLDRLHDLVLPPAVAWWPPAPGWYALFFLLLLIVVRLGWRWWKRWQANAYRRDALRLVATAKDAPALAELLRRAALATQPRQVIAGKTGRDWVEWLEQCAPEAMPDSVRRLLTAGIYGPMPDAPDLATLRSYAARWLAGHQPEKIDLPRGD
jgi:hypothetical protein